MILGIPIFKHFRVIKEFSVPVNAKKLHILYDDKDVIFVIISTLTPRNCECA